MSALLLRGGMVYDAVHSEPFDADILCEDGKIAAIGLGLSVPDGC